MKDVFIIGSGNSLNQLQTDEINYINSCETISINRYLIFYDFIGIIPKYNVYIDNNELTELILKYSIEKIKKNNLTTKLCLSSDILHGTTIREHVFPAYRPYLKENDIDYVKLRFRRDVMLDYAEYSTDYFYNRTTLGCAINLAHVLYGNDINIKCLGIDGGPTYNFSTKLIKYLLKNELIPSDMKRLIDDRPDRPHSSITFNKMLKTDFYQLRVKDRIFIMNKDSELIDNNLFKYGKIKS